MLHEGLVAAQAVAYAEGVPRAVRVECVGTCVVLAEPRQGAVAEVPCPCHGVRAARSSTRSGAVRCILEHIRIPARSTHGGQGRHGSGHPDTRTAPLGVQVADLPPSRVGLVSATGAARARIVDDDAGAVTLFGTPAAVRERCHGCRIDDGDMVVEVDQVDDG